jgi:RNA polymerase sigma factor (sigma-70 family)
LAFVGDREVVASIVAGDPAGLGEAYDRYAQALYAYCRSILREPADAADAVQDTFVIAASRLHDLREPDRFRPWLYTVARNVCLRKLREDKAVARHAPALGVPSSPRPAGPADAARAAQPSAAWDADDIPDPAEIGDGAELAEFRALVRDASGGLTWRDREILRLRLWEGLDPDEAGTVLGVSRGYANALFARARDQLTACLGDLLVARTGRADCPDLRQILADWDGKLTVLLRKRLSRHIERCDTCTGRRRRELVPALLGLSPGVALAGAAAAAAFRDAAAPTGTHAAAFTAAHAAQLPAAVKTQTLAAATGQADVTPAAKAGAQASAFGRDGFPKPAHHGGTWLTRVPHGPEATAGTAAAAVAMAAAVAAALALAAPGGGPHGQIAGGTPGATSGPGGAPRGGSPSGGGPGGRAGTEPANSAGHGGQPPAAGSALALAEPASGPATSGPGATTPPGSTSGNAPQPRLSPSLPTRAPGPPASPPPPKSGTLTVSPATVLLTIPLAGPLAGKTITLTAHGGPVNWSISQSSLLGSLTVSPSSGHLAAGASATVRIAPAELVSLGTTLTVKPGGTPVHVHVLVGAGL